MTTPKTEFYEVAVRAGFYGVDRSGLTGKKDNVRKFWEDMSIKLWLRPLLAAQVAAHRPVRVVDLGCGSGEGLELLTHIPVESAERSEHEFLAAADDLEYVGLDLSPGMIEQGARNYAGLSNVRFVQADLGHGFPLAQEPPFHLYFSSYGSLSHVSADALRRLVTDIVRHADDGALLVFDLLGRYSPEWPAYWTADNRRMLPYNMAYLLPPEERTPERIEWFTNTFWTAAELRETCAAVAAEAGRALTFEVLADRSIFVGRHMDTGLFNGCPQSLRHQVNRLLDHGYRGQLDGLRVDLESLSLPAAACPAPAARLAAYAGQWNTVIRHLDALMNRRDDEVRFLIESSPPERADDLKMLAWLCRNGSRFPVADFWASVVGPQVAVVLRNLEMGLPDAVGCGHALFGVVRIGGAADRGTPPRL